MENLKLSRLQDAIQLHPATLDEVIDQLAQLCSDIILGDYFPTTITGQIIQLASAKFGVRFENLVAAVRAGKWDNVRHILNDQQAKTATPSLQSWPERRVDEMMQPHNLKVVNLSGCVWP
jgi:hypothetical protein